MFGAVTYSGYDGVEFIEIAMDTINGKKLLKAAAGDIKTQLMSAIDWNVPVDLHDNQVAVVLSSANSNLCMAMSRFLATLKKRVNTGRHVTSTDVTMTMAMNATEFDMLFAYPASQLCKFLQDDIKIYARGDTTVIEIYTLHAVFLLLCSGKLGSMEDAFGFSSLLTPMVQIETIGQWVVSTGVPLYVLVHSSLCFCRRAL